MPTVPPEYLGPLADALAILIPATMAALVLLLKGLAEVKAMLRRAGGDAAKAAAETRTNGGGSLRDAINRIEAVQAQSADEQRRLAVRVDEGLHAAQSDIRGVRRDVGRVADTQREQGAAIDRVEEAQRAHGAAIGSRLDRLETFHQ